MIICRQKAFKIAKCGHTAANGGQLGKNINKNFDRNVEQNLVKVNISLESARWNKALSFNQSECFISKQLGDANLKKL